MNSILIILYKDLYNVFTVISIHFSFVQFALVKTVTNMQHKL